MQYSDEDLLTEIRQLSDKLGHPPTLQETRDEGAYAAMTYYNRFGSWRNALEAAGFQAREPEQKIQTEELLAELNRLADKKDGTDPPTAAAMNEEGTYWASTYRRRFGSWKEALETAGFDPPQPTVTDADLIAELRRLADEISDVPTYDEMVSNGRHGAATYARRFGSWNAALEAAGFTPHMDADLSKQELRDELHRLAEDLNDRPSAREMDEYGEYASATYQRHFGSWSKAIKQAFDT